MDVMHIEGGMPLRGQVEVRGAKNATTKLLVASLLSDKPCTFYNVPYIDDVKVTVDLCKEIGMDVCWEKNEGVLHCQTKEIKRTYIPQRFSGSNRIPILMLGALLGRTQQDVIVPTVGGCNLGKRSVNFHIDALTKLGATIELREMRKESAYFGYASEGLCGNTIVFPYPSIGATENAILAAVSAKGTTILKNAAIEPEIYDLVLFLQKIGANIFVDTDRTIKITGTRVFYETEHTIVPDRIVAASFGMLAVGTKGRIFVRGAEHISMLSFLNKLREIGGGYLVKKDGIEFFYAGDLKGGIHLETDVHPGFVTDWQPPFTTLLTQASGASVVHETVYENRLGFISVLQKMGADIIPFKQCLGGKSCRFSSHNHVHSVIVKGPTKFVAKDVVIPDLRAGFSYVMAALFAEGTSTISNMPFIDRGYEKIDETLTSLGASCKRAASQFSSIVEKHSCLGIKNG